MAVPQFDPGFSTAIASECFSAERRVAQLLGVEAALALAQAAVGTIPAEAGERIAEACRALVLNPDEMLSAGWSRGTVLLPVLDALREALTSQTARHVHFGATTQDVVDTTLMLQVRDALDGLLADLERVESACAELAVAHVETPAQARTFLQDAQPITFGLRAARWLRPVSESRRRLLRQREALPLQLGGPVGSLDELGPQASDVVARLAEILGLKAQPTPWHSDRTPIVDILVTVGGAVRAAASIAGDVVLLSQSGSQEVRTDRGGSSSMATKRNPIDALRALAAAEVHRGVAAISIGGRPQELERGVGSWHAELFAVPVALQSASAVVEATATCLDELEVDVDRLTSNLTAPQAVPVEAGRRAVEVALAASLRTGRAPAPDGCCVAYDVAGRDDAPVVVLLHSLGTDRHLWTPQQAALSDDYRVVRIDLRGHGQSDVPTGPYAIDELGEDVLVVLDELRVDSAHICGLSLGGLVSLWLGAQRADRVESLIVSNSAARVGTVESWAERAQAVRERGLEAVARQIVRRFFSQQTRVALPGVVAAATRLLTGTSPEGYAACCEALGAADLRAQVTGITAPALVVAGSRDVATTVADGEWLWAQMPAATLVTLDAGHLSNLERPHAFSRTVRQFLDDRSHRPGENAA